MTNIEFFKTKDACEAAFGNYKSALERARRLKLEQCPGGDGVPGYADWLFHPASTALKVRISVNGAGTYVTADGRPGVAKCHVPSSCVGSGEWPVFDRVSVAFASGGREAVASGRVEAAVLPPGFYAVTVDALIENIREGREPEQTVARILSAVQDRRDGR